MKNKKKGVIVLIFFLLAVALFSIIISRPKKEMVPLVEEPEQKVEAIKPRETITIEDIFERRRFEEMKREGRIEVISEEEKRYMERIKTEGAVEED